MQIYTEVESDCQLDRATTAFLKAEVEIDPGRSIIRANPILRWYRSDFGSLGGLEGLIRRYRPGELDERRWRFTWKKYDWRLWPTGPFPIPCQSTLDGDGRGAPRCEPPQLPGGVRPGQGPGSGDRRRPGI